jgi:hypothetical protein
MPAYLATMGALGVKLVSSYPENPGKFNLSTVQATILYSDHRTGKLLAIMEGGYITAVRTGAVSGVATNTSLARTAAASGYWTPAFKRRRNSKPCAPFDPSNRLKYSVRLRVIATLLQNGCRPSWASRSFLLLQLRMTYGDPRLLSPHPRQRRQSSWEIGSVRECISTVLGSHTPDARELDKNTITKSKVIVDSLDAALCEAGDLLIPIANRLIKQDHIVAELGEVVLGNQPGRSSDEEITLFNRKAWGLKIFAPQN